MIATNNEGTDTKNGELVENKDTVFVKMEVDVDYDKNYMDEEVKHVIKIKVEENFDYESEITKPGVLEQIGGADQTDNVIFSAKEDLTEHDTLEDERENKEYTVVAKLVCKEESYGILPTGVKREQRDNEDDGDTDERNENREERNKTREESHRCSSCNKAMPKRSQIQKQTSANTRIECRLCGFADELSGTCESNTSDHESKRHSNIEPFPCSHSHHGFADKSTLQTHIRKEHSEVKSLESGDREFSSARKASLTEHEDPFADDTLKADVEEKHTEEQFARETCDYSTTSKQCLGGHVGANHPDKKPFKCGECDFSTASRSRLITHARYRHSSEKPFACSRCDYSAVEKKSLWTHVQVKHLNEVFACDHCDYSSASTAYLATHVKLRHNNVRQFTCGQCEFSTKYSQSLRKHVQTKHSTAKPLACNQCDYTTANRASLITHARYRHSSGKPFACSHCDYSAVEKKSLRTHIQVKHSNQVFACDHCDYSSASTAYLATHIKLRHSSVRHFTCSQCEFSSKYSQSLRKHILRKH